MHTTLVSAGVYNNTFTTSISVQSSLNTLKYHAFNFYLISLDAPGSSPSSDSSAVGIGIGVALGIVFAVVAVVLVLYFRRRQPKNQNSKQASGQNSRTPSVKPSPFVGVKLFSNMKQSNVAPPPTLDLSGHKQAWEAIEYEIDLDTFSNTPAPVTLLDLPTYSNDDEITGNTTSFKLDAPASSDVDDQGQVQTSTQFGYSGNSTDQAIAQQDYTQQLNDTSTHALSPSGNSGTIHRYENVVVGQDSQQQQHVIRALNPLLITEPEPEPERLIPPAEWTSVECFRWLKYHGFKEFVDVFYNNGFEGAQLVLVTVESFAAMRNIPRSRSADLIAAISKLKKAGGWIEPKDGDQPSSNAQESAQSGIEGTAKYPLEKNQTCDVCRSQRAILLCLEGCEGRPFCQSCWTFVHNVLDPVQRARHVVQSLEDPNDVDNANMERLRCEYTLSIELDRDETTKILMNASGDDGEYIIRKSSRSPGSLVLSVYSGGKVHNFQLEKREFDGRITTSSGLEFANLQVRFLVAIWAHFHACI